MFDKSRCLNCGACAGVCKNHSLINSLHSFSRGGCTSCGKCAEVCFSGALELCGKEISDTEVIGQVLRDKAFYQNEGGMTLSGGEPLMQPAFSLSLLKLAKENGIHTCVETSGFGPISVIEEIARYTDLFLFDIKHTSENQHILYTGVSNKSILENLAFLDKLNKRIILRCPIIPGVNFTTEHLSFIFALSQKYSSVESVEFEPYHPLGVNKSRLLGRNSAYDSEEFLNKTEISELIDKLPFEITKPYSIH